MYANLHLIPLTFTLCAAMRSQYRCVSCSFHALNIVNARALENANIAVIVGAIVLRAFVYSALYWTLPQDKQTLLKRKAAQSYANEVSELTGKNKWLLTMSHRAEKCQKQNVIHGIDSQP